MSHLFRKRLARINGHVVLTEEQREELDQAALSTQQVCEMRLESEAHQSFEHAAMSVSK